MSRQTLGCAEKIGLGSMLRALMAALDGRLRVVLDIREHQEDLEHTVSSLKILTRYASRERTRFA